MIDAELNEAVARKLGWEKQGGFWWSPMLVGEDYLSTKPNNPLPSFSTSIDAAWDVLEYMRRLLLAPGYFISMNCGIDGFDIRILYDTTGNVAWEATAAIAPRAICEVFLKIEIKET